MSCIKIVSLQVNCGYARTCIYQNSNPKGIGSTVHLAIDTQARADNFKSQFSNLSNYVILDGYFECNGKSQKSQFDSDCEKILSGFRGKFRCNKGLSRDNYTDTFSPTKWSQLSETEKDQHTLGSCKYCYELHEATQLSFPLKPAYRPTPVLTIDSLALKQQGVEQFTTQVLGELNKVYADEVKISFTDALLASKTTDLERKKTPIEKKKERRKIQNAIIKEVNGHFSENAAITMLSE